MSERHPNTEIALAFWDATASGNADELRTWFSEDVVWVVHGRHRDAGEYLGPDGVLEYLAKVGEGAADLNLTLRHVFVNDKGAVLLYHAVARRDARMLDINILLTLWIDQGQVMRADLVPTDQAEYDRFWS